MNFLRSKARGIAILGIRVPFPFTHFLWLSYHSPSIKIRWWVHFQHHQHRHFYYYYIVNTNKLLTKHELMMAGYWISSVYACLWIETESRSINSQKKERGQYPAILTAKAWSIKDLLFRFRENVSRGTRREIPSGQDRYILPTWVANRSAQFGSSCPFTELAIQ